MNKYTDISFTSSSSTSGICSCGGFIDFEKKLPRLKLVLKIGKWYLQKVDRILYQCKKCEVYS